MVQLPSLILEGFDTGLSVLIVKGVFASSIDHQIQHTFYVVSVITLHIEAVVNHINMTNSMSMSAGTWEYQVKRLKGY